MVIHRIHKSGGSYTVVIPKNYLSKLNLVARDYVVVGLRDLCIEIKPLRKYPRPKEKKRKGY